MNSVKIVEDFWERVWKAHNPAAIDDFVVDDFVLTNAGVDVVSRIRFKAWVLGTAPDQQAISFTGTAVWAVREDGKLYHNWVERSSFELFQQLRESRSTAGGL